MSSDSRSTGASFTTTVVLPPNITTLSCMTASPRSSAPEHDGLVREWGRERRQTNGRTAHAVHAVHSRVKCRWRLGSDGTDSLPSDVPHSVDMQKMDIRKEACCVDRASRRTQAPDSAVHQKRAVREEGEGVAAANWRRWNVSALPTNGGGLRVRLFLRARAKHQPHAIIDGFPGI
jgi:hypothetical protein